MRVESRTPELKSKLAKVAVLQMCPRGGLLEELAGRVWPQEHSDWGRRTESVLRGGESEAKSK